ncbi:STM2901 family protein [Pantoea agglomerans]|uniref:STM2901 family protein n=1 Tax=Enterobacter agglomerans TaxID=549 RepID=UPI00301BC16B
MDTTEQLNGTYFYHGVQNLTPQELLFWVLLDETEKQLGVQDIGAVAGIILGNNSIDVPGKPLSATPGTSVASLFFRRHMSYKFRKRILPTLTLKSFSMRGLKIFWVNNLGTFIGRAVPVVGWVILANDVAQISFRTVHRYNLIVRPEDKIW